MATRVLGDGPGTVEIPPTHCPDGHPLTYPNVQVFHLPCSCAGRGGHRGYRCWTCRAVIYEPPHDQTTPPTMGSLYG
jgi:hypothetical protein